MKPQTIIAIAIFSFLSFRGLTQETYIEQLSLPISNTEKESFKVEIQSGDIEIAGVDDNKIAITAEVFNAPNKNYKCGPDGCMDIENDDLKFTIKPREGEKIKKIIARIPKNISIRIKNWGMGSVSIIGMFGEIQINVMRLNDISLQKVIGPLSLFGTYGNIDVEFDKGISKKTMAISLMKGNIKINIPKGEGVTFATSCPDEKSTLKDYPIKRVYSYKQKTDTSNYNVEELEQNKMSISPNYKERMETREYFGFANKNPRTIKRNKISTKEDVWVYDINGGGSNIELKIYQGSIQINESN